MFVQTMVSIPKTNTAFQHRCVIINEIGLITSFQREINTLSTFTVCSILWSLSVGGEMLEGYLTGYSDIRCVLEVDTDHRIVMLFMALLCSTVHFCTKLRHSFVYHSWLRPASTNEFDKPAAMCKIRRSYGNTFVGAQSELLKFTGFRCY